MRRRAAATGSGKQSRRWPSLCALLKLPLQAAVSSCSPPPLRSRTKALPALETCPCRTCRSCSEEQIKTYLEKTLGEAPRPQWGVSAAAVAGPALLDRHVPAPFPRTRALVLSQQTSARLPTPLAHPSGPLCCAPHGHARLACCDRHGFAIRFQAAQLRPHSMPDIAQHRRPSPGAQRLVQLRGRAVHLGAGPPGGRGADEEVRQARAGAQVSQRSGGAGRLQVGWWLPSNESRLCSWSKVVHTLPVVCGL